MSLAHLLSAYLTLNLLVVFTYAFLRVHSLINARANFKSGAAHELKLHYVVLAMMGLLILFYPLMPKREFFHPPLKVWAAESQRSFSALLPLKTNLSVLALPTPLGGRVYDTEGVALTMIALILLVAVLGGVSISRDVLSLLRIRRNSFCVRRIGEVSIYTNDDITVPFSYGFPRHAGIIIPTRLLTLPIDYKMTIVHELQHHRQRDTLWVYLIWFMRMILVPNPIIHLWSNWLSQLQEFACDETLIDRNKVESKQYARCLVEVAQSALNQKYAPVCATGLIFLIEGNILKRRIEKMMLTKQNPLKKTLSFTVTGMVVALMATVAFASQNLVQDRRVSQADAEAWVKNVHSTSGFPIVVNDLVLKELNRYLGTPDGRAVMKLSLQRLENYRGLIEGKLKDYQMPIELLAIPVVESGYQNLSQSTSHGVGAGLWMFLDSTARTYGMRVDAQVDQRLDTALETDAAMRYFKADHLILKDWLLAVLAFNMGERAVQKAITDTGSRDAWTLVRQGHQNDKGYLASVEAAAIILNNPKALE